MVIPKNVRKVFCQKFEAQRKFDGCCNDSRKGLKDKKK